MCELMDQAGVTRSQLASRLKVSRSQVSQLLDGTTNMTLRTVSDVFLALGHEFHPSQSSVEPAGPAYKIIDIGVVPLGDSTLPVAVDPMTRSRTVVGAAS